jgi:hypothetical protein
VAEITADQVRDLLTGTHEYLAAGQAAAKARESLGRLFLATARQAKVGLRELSAVSGLHHSTIRAMLQHAIGPRLPDGWEQPELPVLAGLGPNPAPELRRNRPTRTVEPPSSAPIAVTAAAGMTL